jgi:hypothetical protein
LYAQEHLEEEISVHENLEKIVQNTETLLKEAIKIIEESEFVEKENIKILSLHGKDSIATYDEQMLIAEQFINIQKVAYDICKISERIKL